MLQPSVGSYGRTGRILQEAFKVSANPPVRHVRCSLLGNDNDIGGGGEPGLVKTEELSESPLQRIPLYRLSHFLADDNPQTRPTLPVGTQEHQEIPGGVPPPPSRGCKKFPSHEESVLFG